MHAHFAADARCCCQPRWQGDSSKSKKNSTRGSSSSYSGGGSSRQQQNKPSPGIQDAAAAATGTPADGPSADAANTSGRDVGTLGLNLITPSGQQSGSMSVVKSLDDLLGSDKVSPDVRDTIRKLQEQAKQQALRAKKVGKEGTGSRQSSRGAESRPSSRP